MAYPGSAVSKYNNDPGSGRTGYWEIPPNNYDFYSEEEKYKPNVQADGGILSSECAGRRRRARRRRGHSGARSSEQETCRVEGAQPFARAGAEPLYNPTPEQAEIDRAKAYETGVPHGAPPRSLARASSAPRPAVTHRRRASRLRPSRRQVCRA